MESLMKRSQMWMREDGSDALGGLHLRGLAMDSWMRPQHRPETGLPTQDNEYYRAMAAAALQDFRSVDSSKLSISHTQPSVSAPQLQYHMQTPQVQQQQSQQFMQNISDAPGPLLQLASSRPQSPLGVGVNMPQVYNSEADMHMPSRSVSGTVALHSMLGRTHIGCSISPSESGQINNVMRPNQSSQQSQSGSILQGASVVAREPQVLVCSRGFLKMISGVRYDFSVTFLTRDFVLD